jgi:3-methyladenine DNA glycosylase AlkD
MKPAAPALTPALVLARLRAAFAEAGDPAAAVVMQRYMKSQMPYHGVKSAPMRQIARAVFAGVPLPSAAAWRRLVLHLWRQARYREERYAALVLVADRRARSYQTLEALPMYEEMIVTGAWWDFVDDIAGHRLGPLLERHPREMKRLMRAWSRDENMWKRRSAILCQLFRKKETDLALLYDCIEPSLSSREFFLRKAIGWALRQYAWTDAKEVARYVRVNESRLSGLSRREALKNI